LIDALFTATQQRVLALLFGQPDRSFFATEIIAMAKSGRGAVQRELRRLADSDLVTVTKVGNQKHFQANSAAPIFTELRAIIVKTIGLAEPLREALAPVADDIRLAIIYGSIAKRTDTASSDADLLIVSDTLPLEKVYAVLASAEREIGRKIDVTLYTSAEFRRRRKDGHPFLAKVLSGEYWIVTGELDGGATAR
jgi:predicted nucleotidyltransferase